ncbi:alpha/beta hydrolase [Paenibacillus sp. D2_2]|uniref:alpha/beta fold hydrolase n=1 Tax=Paenibacillus sp. D2_2 TaxID=3073092 RepID=UPI0028152489|nr:alpha/beta hydrolase [Paenibacillus sp. D2_2]WMT39368.1 alpha/beta hydrolase [Paenibacillus sp. D2_2]
MALQYKEYGDQNAPLLLFLHGGGVSGWMWDNQIPYFSHYHSIVPDLPGHGGSDEVTPFSIQDSAQGLIELIEDKAAGKPAGCKVILNGFSLGAQVIIQILSQRPNLVTAAIINSALVRPSELMRKFIRPTVRLSYPLIRNRRFSKLQAKTLYIEEANFQRYYEESCQMKLDTLVRVLEENMSFQIPAGFREARGKLLVTVGAKEKAMMKKSAKDLVKANSNCTGVIIPEMGHGVPLVMPDFFNDLVERWIQEGTLPKACKVIRLND